MIKMRFMLKVVITMFLVIAMMFLSCVVVFRGCANALKQDIARLEQEQVETVENSEKVR